MTEPSAPAQDPTPGDRTLRALVDAVGESRPRVPADAADPDIPVAATVVLVRGGGSGPEVLLIERPDRGSFAGAWVFPGGKIEHADRRMSDTDEAAPARRAAVRETWEEVGVTLAADDLVPFSLWDPPPGLALRIRTWFFVSRAPAAELVLSADEAVDAQWMRPGEVLERHSRGELTLYPPTWVTLHALAAASSADGLLDAARIGGMERFETVARKSEHGPRLLWTDDAEYDADRPEDTASRHRLDIGSLPWIYTRTN